MVLTRNTSILIVDDRELNVDGTDLVHILHPFVVGTVFSALLIDWRVVGGQCQELDSSFSHLNLDLSKHDKLCRCDRCKVYVIGKHSARSQKLIRSNRFEYLPSGKQKRIAQLFYYLCQSFFATFLNRGTKTSV